MKHHATLRIAAFLTLTLAVPATAEEPGAGPAVGSPATPHFAADVRASMDLEAEPCVDFYRYACGGWLDSTELPSDQTRWARSFSVIHERNREVVRDILEQAAADPGTDPGHRQIGDYYASCMDEAAIEKAAAAPLAPLLEDIAGVEGAASLLAVTGKLHRHEVGALFGMGALADFKDPDLNIAFYFQGGLGMPDRDYYVAEDEKKRQLMAEYQKHVAHMLALLGQEAEQAAADAARIVAFETRLAVACRPRTEMRVLEKLYNRIDVNGLKQLTPKLPWDAYLAATGYPGVTEASIATPEFFEALETAVHDTDPAVLRAYLRWHLVNSAAGVLSSAFVDADFDFYGRKLQGQQEMQPRWKRCVAATEGALGEAVGRLYVERRFAGGSKQVALEMIHDIETAFENSLPRLSWMDQVTRDRAVEKAKAVGNKIGYPDTWRDYSSMKVKRGGHFANTMAARGFDFDRDARKIGQPVDRQEWRMTPQMVNAYYTPLQNEIVFPAGILQPPFFHRDFPAAMNYGAIGAVMGHELSHGFDDQGRKFDPRGQLRQWWEPAASERFSEQAGCVDDLYSGYEVEPDVRVNGKLTLGENIADIGGVKQAYAAYQSWQARHEAASDVAPEARKQDIAGSGVEGLSDDQLFFVAFGQVWCSLSTPEQVRLRITTDSHAPPRFRVIGSVSNNRAFAEAFGCAEGTPMRPETVCEVW